MSRARVYLPLRPDQLRELAERRLVRGPLEAYAVTGSVRRSDPDGDEESWEHDALQDAAAERRESGGPVLVAAADLDRSVVDDRAPHGSRVRVTTDLLLARIAAFHAGDDLLRRPAPDRVDPDAQIELSWFDTSELGHLVTLV